MTNDNLPQSSILQHVASRMAATGVTGEQISAMSKAEMTIFMLDEASRASLISTARTMADDIFAAMPTVRRGDDVLSLAYAQMLIVFDRECAVGGIWSDTAAIYADWTFEHLLRRIDELRLALTPASGHA